MLSSLASAAGLSRPKKKFHFDVNFLLEELLNCTYLTGAIFAKIRLRDGGTFSELSDSCDVKSHCIKWNQTFQFHSKMYASPSTGELEPCYCKVSIRKETKGGRSYKKLGYIKINLAEYAGAGATQRKYLLESYNENKHKPDNSILQVTISLRQTSGDSLFKVPQGAGERQWELSENPTDEGIQPDIQPRLSYTSHASVQSNSLANFHLGGVVSGNGGSLQDVRHGDGEELSRHRKASSALNLRRPSISDLTPASIQEEKDKTEETVTETSDNKPPRILSPHILLSQKPNRSSSFNSSAESCHSPQPELVPSGLKHHRRLGSWSQVGTSSTTPPTTIHRRQQSLVSGQSSKSTSAYSTLSERSGTSMEAGDGDSISLTLKGRLTLLATSSRVEQSRVNPQAVINHLFSGHNFDSSSETEKGGGLKIYVDKNLGTVTLAGPNLDRKNSNLQAIDVNEHKSTSPKRRRKKLHTARDIPVHSRENSIHEQSPPLSSSSSMHSQNNNNSSSSAASTKTITPPPSPR